jgi:hypothetical protein
MGRDPIYAVRNEFGEKFERLRIHDDACCIQ